MLGPIAAIIAIIVAAAVMAAGFFTGISVLVTVGMILLPLTVLLGVPMWGRRTQ